MNRKMLIVAPAEGFLIKGLETKLKAMNIQPYYAGPKVKELTAKCDLSDLIFIFTDESLSEYAEALVYIKDRCSENDTQVVVIGTEEECNTLKHFIPETYIYRFFKRPLAMDQLVTEIEFFMEDSAQQARRKSILIVDDDVSYMSMIMDWLKDKYRISMANSGVEAITWLATNHADLVLLDYEMPITPGPQVLEMIRSEPSLAPTPVMFLTGKGDKESIMKVLSLKPAGYLLKSIDRQGLHENIGGFFAKQAAKTV